MTDEMKEVREIIEMIEEETIEGLEIIIQAEIVIL